mgnify:CR=1 FL=1
MQAQAAAFAASLALGILYGVLYDIVRFSRVLLFIDVRPPRGGRDFFRLLLVALGDFLFLVVCAVLACVFFFVTGDGRVRGFVLVGAFCGFLAYYHTVGRLFITVVEAVAAAVRRFIRAACRLLLRPFAAAVRRARAAAQKIAKPVASRARAWYNRKKEERNGRRRRAAEQQRMARCDIVCANGKGGGNYAENRTGTHAVFGAGGAHRRADPRAAARRRDLDAAERSPRQKRRA